MTEKYDHKNIERKWQDEWEKSGIYRTTEDPLKPKTFVLDMFPYPSGEGLHVGHPKGYIATDIYSRTKRMQGHNVLHPMGWDAFGLPAENFAIKNKIHPRSAVEKNIANFKAQLAHIGFDYDWSREINTTDPAYYKWTQWIFLQLFKKGLAYQSNEPINWCPSCMTGLANEDLNGDVCERCDTPVEKKRLPQWVLRITEYADRMLADLDTLDWPEHIKEAQRNWIGRSEGAEIDFTINFKIDADKNNAWRDKDGKPAHVTIFTTRPDTLFGATYLVLAPEHPWVRGALQYNRGAFENSDEVEAYVKATANRSDIDRTASKEKTGVELKGIKAINPANQEEISVWIADYVISSYGTGAIMAVPAHDERDNEFAKLKDLPIKQVVAKGYVHEHGAGAFLPGGPIVETDGVIVVIKHWSEEKYLALKWKKVDWNTFLTGTVDEGETPESTVIKEIREETGYLHARVTRKLGVVDGLFYHVVKKTNKLVHGHMYVVELEDGEQEQVAPEESAKHDIVWLNLDDMESFLGGDGGTHVYTLDVFRNGYKPYTGTIGTLIDSGEFTGLPIEEAKQKITEYAGGRMKTTYKLRDWVFSRQRYWGEPIPIIHCPKDGAVTVPESDLPVLLPEVESYEPSGTGESPLASITEWVNTTCPTCGGPAKRETNTMPQWAGSSWYYLRFMDPHNAEAMVDTEKEKYWAPVDVYVGGDHAVRHLIYARFWHKFLYDIGSVSTVEPFARLEFLGFILAEDGRKMSKRYGNVINPTDVVNEYGADAFRVYEMFMGPFENTVAWSTNSIIGTSRFIERLWRTAENVGTESVPELEKVLNQTIKKVSEDIEAFKFNTAVSQMMIFLNAVEKAETVGQAQWESFLKVMAPFAPHITEELWHKLHTESIHLQNWPTYDESKLVEDIITLAVQVNGKTRTTIDVTSDISEDDAKKSAEEAVSKWLEGKTITKTVYVTGRLVSFVVSE